MEPLRNKTHDNENAVSEKCAQREHRKQANNTRTHGQMPNERMKQRQRVKAKKKCGSKQSMWRLLGA